MGDVLALLTRWDDKLGFFFFFFFWLLYNTSSHKTQKKSQFYFLLHIFFRKGWEFEIFIYTAYRLLFPYY